jgi:hypothetical protein
VAGRPAKRFDSLLHVSVYIEGRLGSDELVGSGSVPLRRFAGLGMTSLWLPLRHAGERRGDVNIELALDYAPVRVRRSVCVTPDAVSSPQAAAAATARKLYGVRLEDLPTGPDGLPPAVTACLEDIGARGALGFACWVEQCLIGGGGRVRAG